MNGQAIGGFNMIYDGTIVVSILIGFIIGFIIASYMDSHDEKE